MSDIAVLGAGPAGLMAALKARERGHEVTIFEASDRVGGMAASFEVAGQRVDYGSHRLHPATEPSIMSLIKELLGDDLQTRQRNGRIRLRNRWIKFPLRTMDMIQQLPLAFSSAAVFDTLTTPFRSKESNDFQSEIERRLGPTVAKEFYGPYVTKLYGTTPDQLTTELSDRRVSASGPLQILGNAIRNSQAKARIFYYPRRGYGQITEALAETAIAQGVNIRLSSPIERLTVNETAVDIYFRDTRVQVQTVLSSIPLPSLAATLQPPPPSEVIEAIASQRTRGMVIAYLVVPQAQYTHFDAHYFPGSDVSTARLSEPKNYRTADDPIDVTVLCAELACWVDDETWHLDREAVGQLVAEDLKRSGLPPTNHVHTEIRRLGSVYPVYEHSTLQARRTIKDWVGRPKRVVTLGRQGLGVPDNLHHVLAMGKSAAQAINSSGFIDATQWQKSLEEFSKHVVQD